MKQNKKKKSTETVRSCLHRWQTLSFQVYAIHSVKHSADKESPPNLLVKHILLRALEHLKRHRGVLGICQVFFFFFQTDMEKLC